MNEEKLRELNELAEKALRGETKASSISVPVDWVVMDDDGEEFVSAIEVRFSNPVRRADILSVSELARKAGNPVYMRLYQLRPPVDDNGAIGG